MTVERLGRYRITGELARGASGVVYSALDPDGRAVALKVLHAPEATGLRRFERERDALSRLHHPNVVAVLESGIAEGRPWLAMELVVGGTLQHRLDRQGPLGSEEAARLVQKLALAVAHAHAQGLLHRDLKPGNVLLAGGREPRLTDFGLTRALELEGASSLSRAGQLLGTPGWWPPEQAAGQLERIGPRYDVWGLGAILYGALTGVPPFQGATLAEVLAATLAGGPPPPSRLVPGIDPALERVCLCCLETDPARRYDSASAVAAALGRVLRGESRHRRAPLLGLPFLLAACVAIAVALRGKSSPEEVPPSDPAAPVSSGPDPRLERAYAVAAEADLRYREFARVWMAQEPAGWGPDFPPEVALRESLELYARAIELAPERADIRGGELQSQQMLTRLLVRTGRDPGAEIEAGLHMATRLIELEPRLAQHRKLRAVFHQYRREWLVTTRGDISSALDATIAELEEACRLDPTDVDAHDILGSNTLIRVQMAESAGRRVSEPDLRQLIRCYDVVIARGRDDCPSWRDGEAWLWRGLARLSLGDQGGREDLRRALEIKPGNRQLIGPEIQALVDAGD